MCPTCGSAHSICVLTALCASRRAPLCTDILTVIPQCAGIRKEAHCAHQHHPRPGGHGSHCCIDLQGLPGRGLRPAVLHQAASDPSPRPGVLLCPCYLEPQSCRLAPVLIALSLARKLWAGELSAGPREELCQLALCICRAHLCGCAAGGRLLCNERGHADDAGLGAGRQ